MNDEDWFQQAIIRISQQCRRIEEKVNQILINQQPIDFSLEDQSVKTGTANVNAEIAKISPHVPPR